MNLWQLERVIHDENIREVSITIYASATLLLSLWEAVARSKTGAGSLQERDFRLRRVKLVAGISRIVFVMC